MGKEVYHEYSFIQPSLYKACITKIMISSQTNTVFKFSRPISERDSTRLPLIGREDGERGGISNDIRPNKVNILPNLNEKVRTCLYHRCLMKIFLQYKTAIKVFQFLLLKESFIKCVCVVKCY